MLTYSALTLWSAFILVILSGKGSQAALLKQKHSITAAEWGSLWTTRWSDAPSIEGLQKSLDPDILDAYLAAGSHYMEGLLQPNEKTIYIARYYAHQEVNATAAAHALMVPAAITAIRGCCENVGHFLMYTTKAIKQELVKRSDIFLIIQAVPPQLKVEPTNLGKLLESVDSDESLPKDTQAIGVRVVLAQDAAGSATELQPILAQLNSVVNRFSAGGVQVVAQQLRSLLIRPLTLSQAYTFTKQAALLPFVQWIEPFSAIVTLNKFAKGLIQGDAPYDNAPLYKAGLTGAGQIISAIDTGLDTTHCFFKDKDMGPPTDTIDRAQRKVLKYLNLADKSDVAGGHGTHVCGTALGSSSPEGQFSKGFGGVAPDAKLVFYDIGLEDGTLPGLDVTTMSHVLEDARDSGASIHLNAWGTLMGSYQMTTSFNQQDIDKFLFENTDFLVVQAAGNDGRLGRYTANFTVGFPGVSKNALTVGASLSQAGSFEMCQEYCKGQEETCSSCATFPDPNAPNGKSDMTTASRDPGFVAPFSSRGPTRDGRIKPDIVAPGYRVWSADAHGSKSPVHDSCTLLAAQGTSSAAAVAAGAAALVRNYFTSGYYPSGHPEKEDCFVPSGALIKACLIHSGLPLQGVVRATEHPSTGAIRSFHFVNFAEHGVASPNIFEGHGLLRLDRVLRMAASEGGEASGPSALWVRSGKHDGAVIRQGLRHTYRFDVLDSSHPLRATLVWMDPAAPIGAALSLVNDLDLSMELPDGSILHPNGLSQPDPNNNVERLQVASPQAGKSYLLTVAGSSVFGGRMQPYSLVVTGTLKDVTQVPHSIAIAPPKASFASSCIFLDPSCKHGICQVANTSSCPALAGGVREASNGAGSTAIGRHGIFKGPAFSGSPDGESLHSIMGRILLAWATVILFCL